jgi:hypothetical protein
MKKLIAVLALATPAIAFAVNPPAINTSAFAGTWKTRLDAAQFSKKPDTFAIEKGKYSCASCVPVVEVKADGADQPVTGHDYYDTVAVKVLNRNSFKIVRKKGGKVMYESTETVAADGNTLDVKFSDQSGAQEATGEIAFKRTAPMPAGAHAASGSWQYEKLISMSDNGAIVKFASIPNGIKMSMATGQSYEAKFDGKEVPMQGDPGQTVVSVQMIGPRDIEETDKRNGKHRSRHAASAHRQFRAREASLIGGAAAARSVRTPTSAGASIPCL